ncbi:hypothetical protein BGX33_005403 [Mortierella sp. NVP41]|nr:hypothetical protein BGX33_005403 [Mortierella sp. NVP41]
MISTKVLFSIALATSLALTTVLNPTSASPALQPRSDDDKRCKEATGRFPAKHCNQFVNCIDYKATVMDCAATTYFNPETKDCDYGCHQ